MSVNQNWSRWIFASVGNHFDNLRQGIPLYIEGQPRIIDRDNAKAIFELRVDGPYFTEVSRKYWDIYIEINVLIQSVKTDTDFHRIRRLTGIVESAFIDIMSYRYGDGVDDDDSYLGCLRLIQNLSSSEKIQTSHFGQLDPATNLEQSTVEGHYKMTLNE